MESAIVVLVTGLIMGALARARLRQRSATEQGKLVHPTSTLVVGLVPIVLFLGIAIVSNTVGKNSTTTIWTTLGFIAFALMGVPLVLDYFFARHQLLADGMAYGGMLGKRGRFSWSQVTRVRYSQGAKWFVLDLHSGARVRISAMLLGLPEFAAALLAHVPRAFIDSASYEVLHDTAQGRPPSLWE